MCLRSTIRSFNTDSIFVPASFSIMHLSMLSPRVGGGGGGVNPRGTDVEDCCLGLDFDNLRAPRVREFDTAAILEKWREPGA